MQLVCLTLMELVYPTGMQNKNTPTHYGGFPTLKKPITDKWEVPLGNRVPYLVQKHPLSI